MKCEYVLHSLHASIGSTKTSNNASLSNTNVINNTNVSNNLANMYRFI